MLHQPDKMSDGVFLLKPGWREQLEGASDIAQRAPQVIDFEQGRLWELFEPSRGEHSDAQGFHPDPGGAVRRDENRPFATRSRRAQHVVIFQSLKRQAHRIAADFE
jgi:hypothetical protein